MCICFPQSPTASGRNLASTLMASSWGKTLFTYASCWITMSSTSMPSSMAPTLGSPESTRRNCWEGRGVRFQQHSLAWDRCWNCGLSAPKYIKHEKASSFFPLMTTKILPAQLSSRPEYSGRWNSYWQYISGPFSFFFSFSTFFHSALALGLC